MFVTSIIVVFCDLHYCYLLSLLLLLLLWCPYIAFFCIFHCCYFYVFHHFVEQIKLLFLTKSQFNYCHIYYLIKLFQTQLELFRSLHKTCAWWLQLKHTNNNFQNIHFQRSFFQSGVLHFEHKANCIRNQKLLYTQDLAMKYTQMQ